MLGKKIGGEVKITPELDLLIKQLNNFANSQPDRENIHIALSGYMRDPVSNFVRYQFIESILAVEEIADEIVHQKQKGYEYVKQISDAIKQLISSVDQFHGAFIQHLREPTVVIHSVKGSKIGGVPSDSKDPGSEAEDEVEIDEDDIIQGVEIDDEQY